MIATKQDILLKGKGPLFARVRENLHRQIVRMPVGAKLPPERSLAKKFDVDRLTVRRAMGLLAKEGYIIRHQGRGTFVTDRIDLEKPTATSSTIACIMPFPQILSHRRMIEGMQQEAAARGHDLLLKSFGHNPQQEWNILEALAEEDLAGIITFPIPENVLDEAYMGLINGLLETGRKVVLMDMYVPGSAAPVAMADKHQVGYLAVEHLIMLGHRKICYVTTRSQDTTGKESFNGYRDALSDYGVKFDEGLVIDLPIKESAGPAHDAIHERLQDNPRFCTAIATSHFSMAYGIYNALIELGRTPARDISLIGNDMEENPEYMHVTHTIQPHIQVGREAVKLLLAEDYQKSRNRHVLLKSRLHKGDTCGQNQ